MGGIIDPLGHLSLVADYSPSILPSWTYAILVVQGVCGNSTPKLNVYNVYKYINIYF